MRYFVYALTDPRTDAVFYIGITHNTSERLKQHISHRDTNARKRAWIQKLKEENLLPSMKVIEVVKNKEVAIEREEYWICYYLEQGVSLTNLQLYSAGRVRLEMDEIQEQEYSIEEEHTISKRIKELFYSSAEVRENLGLANRQLQQWINTGRIEKIFLPGSKLPFYSKRKIDKLANEVTKHQNNSNIQSKKNAQNRTRQYRQVKPDETIELYYTAAEARKVLGLTDSEFQWWSRAGRVERVLLPKKKQYLYPKHNIDSLTKELEEILLEEEMKSAFME
jgi:predicted GIY-YIG superfamily endonuclease